MEGEVSSGVVLQADGLYVYSEEDIFGEPRVRRRSRPVSKGALLNLEELKPDDVVVHIDHGIGRYRGLRHMKVAGTEGDFLALEYAAGDAMYVAVERINLVQRYIAGFGKTEVALRAAFIAVMDGRQVAMLVPTTVLAEQHWNTMRKRFDGYPVRIEMVSRFRNAPENKAVIEDVRQGKVDIVIGTHRLIQDDVEFPRLGLLIVDEEHRFGVADKERIKRLRKLVEVLTLTATPIPRTLHMAMLGIRDLSVIQTAPPDRQAIRPLGPDHDHGPDRRAD